MYSLTRHDPLAAGSKACWASSSVPKPRPSRCAWTSARPRMPTSSTPSFPASRKDQIEVEIEGNEVSIAARVGDKREPREGREVAARRALPGPHARRFALPQDLDESRADAKFTDGVLELTLPNEGARRRPKDRDPVSQAQDKSTRCEGPRGKVRRGPFPLALE